MSRALPYVFQGPHGGIRIGMVTTCDPGRG
jgi:hypothetical protein